MSGVELVTTARPADEPATAAQGSIEQRGNVLGFLPHAIFNALLVIATFNLYIFWASSSIRRYIWSTTAIGGRSFEYTGNGKDLALGFAAFLALLLLVLGLPAAVLVTEASAWLRRTGVLDNVRMTGIAFIDFLILLLLPASLSLLALIVELAPEIHAPAGIVVACAIVVVLGWMYALTVSRHLAYRYLLGHTYWQGARVEISASHWRYANQLFLPELSRGLTLGWTGPWRYVLRWQRLLADARFGTHPIEFRGCARALYPHFAVAWATVLGAVIAASVVIASVLGTAHANGPFAGAVCSAFLVTVVVVAYYSRQVYRHMAASISIGAVRLRFTGTTWNLALLYLTNLVMNVLSTGLAYYYTRLRIAKYIAAHVVVEGDPSSLASLEERQAPLDRSRFGQGLDPLIAASHL